MESKNYKYNAFISYRHSDLDKYVAENLQRLIETYKMPKSIIEKYNITDNNFRRVFRDQDELPLSSSLEDPIIEALKESEFLLVICSPRLNESKWCKKEIENFIKFHGRDHILCVLVEGEPDESFPEILKYKEEKVVSKNGKERTKKVPCEPLAMDVRGNDKKEINQKLKAEFIRAIAPMYNLDYDDIKRRHEEREQKRKGNILKTITFASLVFAIYSFMLFSKIYSSSKELKYNQAINLANEAHSLFSKDDRVGAVEKSYQSVTQYNNIKLPITSSGIYELSKSLYLYDYNNNSYFYPISQLKTNGIVKHVKTNKNKDYLLSYDDSYELNFWDLIKEKKIKTVFDTRDNYKENEYTFIENKAYAYINNNKEVVVFDFQGKEIKRFQIDADSVSSDYNGKYLEISTSKTINIYETDNYTLVASYEVKNERRIRGTQFFDDNGENLIFVTENPNDDFFKNGKTLNVLTYNIKRKKILSKIKLISSEVLKPLFIKNDVVLLSRKYKDIVSSASVITKYNYKTGKVFYQKTYLGGADGDIEYAISDNGDTTFLFDDCNLTRLFDFNSGKIRTEKSIGSCSTMIEQGKVKGVGAYRVYTEKSDAYVFRNTDNGYSVMVSYSGNFNAGLLNYKKFLYTKVGYLGYARSDDRIIIYGTLHNNDRKEIEYKEKKYEYIGQEKEDKIKKEYHFDNSALISNLFYSDDEKLLFVTYKNKNELEIYDNYTKELINSVPNVSHLVDMFIAKTKENYYIVRAHIGVGYILNDKFELISVVKGLNDYSNGKLIIEDDDKFYEMKMYTEKEIIEKGEQFLKEKGRL